MSHSNYVGIYWLSVLFYAITFYCLYRAALLLVHDCGRAFIASLPMAIPFFLWPFHREIRAEDFSNVFFAASLWMACRLCVGHDASARVTAWACALLGVSTASLLLIKYNYAAMQFGFVVVAGVALVRHKHNLAVSTGCYLAGFALVAIPFLICLYMVGALGDFINEYFLSAAKTITEMHGRGNSGLLSDLLCNKFYNLYELLMLFGIVVAMRRWRGWWWVTPFLLCVFVGIFAVGYHWQYHFSVLAILYFPLCLWCATKLPEKLFSGSKLPLMAAFILLVSYAINFPSMRCSLVGVSDEKRARQHYAMTYWASQIENPKFLYLMCGDYGYGVSVNGLPATKYWANQNGATSDMVQDQLDAIAAHRPDFVITVQDWMDARDFYANARAEAMRLLKQHGYRAYGLPNTCVEGHQLVMYSRHRLASAQSISLPTGKDVVLKRNPQNAFARAR